jgi:hypothetical protein
LALFQSETPIFTRSFNKRNNAAPSPILSLLAKREHPEKWYQQKWCEANKGQVEVVLPDGTRCDCVTDTHAIEFDFGGT